jgi:hypothetical protein
MAAASRPGVRPISFSACCMTEVVGQVGSEMSSAGRPEASGCLHPASLANPADSSGKTAVIERKNRAGGGHCVVQGSAPVLLASTMGGRAHRACVQQLHGHSPYQHHHLR